MTLEQQIEAVLREALRKDRLNYAMMGNRVAHEALAECIQKLVVLHAPTTQPDREALSAIYRYYGIPWGEQPAGFIQALIAWATPTPLRKEELDKIVHAWCGEVSGTMTPEQMQKELSDRILAWLHGRRETVKTWCKHIVFSDEDWFSAGEFPHNIVPDNQDICPVAGCHAPRPKTE